MEYTGPDAPPPYQTMPVPQPGYQTIPAPQPGFQGIPAPKPGFQEMPSPQPGYQEMPSPQSSTNVIVTRYMFRDYPMQVTCGNCGQTVMTTVIKTNGIFAFLAALVVFFICFPFFWVPLVIDACKDYRHVCPACHALLGTYRKI